MTTNDYLPAFASNRHDLGMTVGNEVSRLFRVIREKYAATPNAAIATAYINPAGFALLADELEQVPRVRLLLGAEPQQDAVRALAAQDADYDDRVSEALDNHEAWLKSERDAMGFDRKTTLEAQRMVQWLREQTVDGEVRVEVRRYTEGFLHGKAYISDDETMPAVLAGSSNMTYAGLHLNAELNLGYPAGDAHHSAHVVDWFDHYWEQSDPYDLAEIYAQTWDEHQPWTIFLRMLWELYGAHLDEEKPAAKTAFNLTRFQSDGVARMERLLESLGGVLVADEVGLGKTYLAAEVVNRATEELRQRVLIIAPAALKSSVWDPFMDKHAFRLTDVFSYEQVRGMMDPKHKDYNWFTARVQEYAMVVVDEAHNLRNSGAARSEAVDSVIVGGKYPKKVVLLTATPVNNSLRDLETLVRYFVRDDAQFAGIGIPSIRGYIKNAMNLEPENLTPEHLFDLMDQVAVRRTRKFVKEQYPGETIIGPGGKPMVIKFPKPSVRRVDYELDDKGIELIDRMVYALDIPDSEPHLASFSVRRNDHERLLLSRYTSSAYAKSGDLEAYQISNAGLLRSALLKRLESSPAALANTLGVLIATHEGFLKGLDAGFVLQGGALREYSSSESDDLAVIIAALADEEQAQAQPIALYDATTLRDDVMNDLALLERLRVVALEAAGAAEPKAQRLVDELAKIAKTARPVHPAGLSSGDRRKVIVFSTFADSILDLHERVSAALKAAPAGSPLSDYAGRLAPPVLGAYASVEKAGKSGGVSQSGRAEMVAKFAPATAGRLNDDGDPVEPDEYDILLTTDVLAEGVNLQQAGQIINYDLPWNPMKIVQRHGRVDRIGSKHDEVRMGLFFPAERLDLLLKLEATLERKLAQAEAAVGMGDVLPGRRSSSDINFADPDRAIVEIEELLESRGSGAALSGEEYRRRLHTAFTEDKLLRREVLDLPFGSGSGFESTRQTGNGFVFCVKVAEHAQPWFRYVPVDEAWATIMKPSGDGPFVNGDTLASLVAADPRFESQPRWMTEEMYDKAFDAWVVARGDVHDLWSAMTDPNFLMAEPPLAFREASELVVRAGGFLGKDGQIAMIRRLRTVPAVKVARAVRGALTAGEDDADKIKLVRDELDTAGIQPAPDPQPLPPVTPEQVRLVAWMAVRGTKGT